MKLRRWPRLEGSNSNTMNTMQKQDICRNRHGGNPNSEQANDKVAATKALSRHEVEMVIFDHPEGITAKDVAVKLDKGFNCISPRVTELKRKGRVFAMGVREGSGILYHADNLPRGGATA